ncbi:MAG: hypothetical protein QOG30_443 [Acidimicrobiaceae bacterium]
MIAGSILAVIGVVVLAAGALVWGVSGERDRAGYFRTHTEPIRSQQFAITSDPFDLGDDARPHSGGWDFGDFVKLQLRAEASDPSTPVFVGVARTSDVDAYLAGVAHDVVVDFDTDPFAVDYRSANGDRQPARPGTQTFWAASSAGSGPQSVDWTPSNGNWTVVVMNADGHKNVAADLDVGVNVKHLGLIISSLLVTGVLITAGGTALIVVSIRRSRRPMVVRTF